MTKHRTASSGIATIGASNVHNRLLLPPQSFLMHRNRASLRKQLTMICVAMLSLQAAAMCATAQQPAAPTEGSGKAAAKQDAAKTAVPTKRAPTTTVPAGANGQPALGTFLNQEAPTAAPRPMTRLDVHVTTEDATPIVGALLQFNGRIGGKNINRKVKTDAEGVATLEYSADSKVQYFWFTCSKDGFVPQHYSWNNDATAVELPARLDLRLAQGVTISGIIQDEDGDPVWRAQVEFTMPITWPQRQSHVFTAAELTTDQKGHWTWSGAPADATRISMRVAHPDFLSDYTSLTDRQPRPFTLKRGLALAGNVVDGDGNPVAGASVGLGYDRFGSDEPETKTGDNGRFALDKCKPGKTLVTVQAEGYSPQFKEVTIGNTNDEVTFTLEPGHVLKVRVVDAQGNPLPKVMFATDTWRNHRSLRLRRNTDAEGRVIWTSAPEDVVLCDVLHTGFMSMRRLPLKASNEEHVITLHRPLVVSGRVTDAKTGKPLPAFRIQRGYRFNEANENIYWERNEPISFKDGSYSYTLDEPRFNHLFQALADGYRPATSRAFTSDEGEQTFDFALEPGMGPSGIVLLPNGEPAAEAEVAIASPSRRASLRQGHFDRSQNQAEIVKTDATGRFQFPALDDQEQHTVLALHDAGFAQLELKDHNIDTIKLSPWGKIEGRVLVGNKLDVSRNVTYQPTELMQHDSVFRFGYDALTDGRGRFHFDRVIPGKGTAYRLVVTKFGRSMQSVFCWSTPVEVSPNETTQVTIGGTGRPVQGQVLLNPQPEAPIDWKTNEPVELEPWDKATGHRARFETNPGRYRANFDGEGRFEIPDVPAGSYRLIVKVNGSQRGEHGGPGEVIAQATIDFDIPEMPGGRSDEPLDLGVVKATQQAK